MARNAVFAFSSRLFDPTGNACGYQTTQRDRHNDSQQNCLAFISYCFQHRNLRNSQIPLVNPRVIRGDVTWREPFELVFGVPLS